MRVYPTVIWGYGATLFIYVGMEYIFSKAQEAEVEKQLREAGGKLSEHGALLLNRGLLLLKLE